MKSLQYRDCGGGCRFCAQDTWTQAEALIAGAACQVEFCVAKAAFWSDQ